MRIFGWFEKKDSTKSKSQPEAVIDESCLYDYPGEFCDLVFYEHADGTGKLQYAGKIQLRDEQYCWFSGDPDEEDAMADQKANYLPILSHANLKIVRDNIDMHTPNGYQSHKLGSEAGINLEDVKKLMGVK